MHPRLKWFFILLVGLLLPAFLHGQTQPAYPELGVNIAWGFVYACPPADPSCAPNVEYAALPAFAYTDAQNRRTGFANWVRDVALPRLKAEGMTTVRMFFTPGTDVACRACGYSGAPIDGRPYLLPRGTLYKNGLSYPTRSQPALHDWVYTNLETFFRDLASAGLAVDLTLCWDENYAYWSKGRPAGSPASEGDFVGFAALDESWRKAAGALVASGASIIQIEPCQETQLFATYNELRFARRDRKRGWIPSRILPEGEYSVHMGQAQTELYDNTIGPLHAAFPVLAGRIFPGLELRGGMGFCNIGSNNGWGDGPWPVTDIASYYRYISSRRAMYPNSYPYLLQYPEQVNFHNYSANDLGANILSTADDHQHAFDDLAAFLSGGARRGFTECSGVAPSPAPFSNPPRIIFGESNSSIVTGWDALLRVTQGYSASELAAWTGGYSNMLLMPWFFGYQASQWDPENTRTAISPPK